MLYYLQRVQHPLLLLQLVLQRLHLWTWALVLLGVQSPNHLEMRGNHITHPCLFDTVSVDLTTLQKQRHRLLATKIDSHSWLFPGTSYISPPSVSFLPLSSSGPLPARPPVGLSGKETKDFFCVRNDDSRWQERRGVIGLREHFREVQTHSWCCI